ncbi:flagellar basal body-associated FliL family protein [Roseospira visakhapatnamensis]|uniref:Flagellar protein FliL n=1 Tax=Roseospira visakhapatnamensis TaxID=390880 RepID=A0A7W6RAN5_9PROT|nr:flagellar basal body-associated FliL family protein [Roseospira visakhapatnamensis]MBB4264837.1 hypothetical protein [Roseospira visakhapatnamensis]
MKGLIIVFLIILLVGGVGGGLTAFGVIPDVLGVKPLLAGLMGSPAPPEEEVAAVPEPAPVDHGPEPQFLRVPQMAVPVLRQGVTPKHILLSLRLHVSPDQMADVRRDMPRLQDAYVTALLKTLPDIMDRSGRLDLASIKAVLNAVSDRAIGPDKVHDVLIEGAFER